MNIANAVWTDMKADLHREIGRIEGRAWGHGKLTTVNGEHVADLMGTRPVLTAAFLSLIWEQEKSVKDALPYIFETRDGEALDNVILELNRTETPASLRKEFGDYRLEVFRQVFIAFLCERYSITESQAVIAIDNFLSWEKNNDE